MKYAIVALLMAFSVTEADAVVYCAAGAYHAGCVRRPAGGAVVGACALEIVWADLAEVRSLAVEMKSAL